MMQSHKTAPSFLPLSPPHPATVLPHPHPHPHPHPEVIMYSTSSYMGMRFGRREEEEEEDNFINGRSQQLLFADLGELDQSSSAPTFHPHDALHLSSSSMFNLKPGNAGILSSNFHYPSPSSSSLNQVVVSSPTAGGGGGGGRGEGFLNTGQQYMYQKETTTCNNNNNNNKYSSFGKNNSNIIENWGESAMADNSQQTEASTDIDTDEKCQGVKNNSVDQSRTRPGDQKTVRRLVQNREAARRSRLRKKAYVQQLEASKLRLAQLAQELQRVRQQGTATGVFGSHGHHSKAGNGAVAFDMDYARWLDEHHRLISDLRSAVNSHVGDNELGLRVDGVMAHYDEIFHLKSIGAKADVFHVLSGMWKSPVERCFMWLGGFRSSELLKILGSHLEPLADRQLMGICNLQQSSQQAEDALSQGMEALQQSLVDTLSSASLGPAGTGNVSDYMGQMAIAMGKLAMLESLVHQADLLRQKTLQQMHQILSTRQAARALLVISDYSSRLRALSSLWLARPRNS